VPEVPLAEGSPTEDSLIADSLIEVTRIEATAITAEEMYMQDPGIMAAAVTMDQDTVTEDMDMVPDSVMVTEGHTTIITDHSLA
jgi:predicted nuclease of predicted toxin-antitoxin system